MRILIRVRESQRDKEREGRERERERERETEREKERDRGGERQDVHRETLPAMSSSDWVDMGLVTSKMASCSHFPVYNFCYALITLSRPIWLNY